MKKFIKITLACTSLGLLSGCNLLEGLEPPQINIDSICNNIYVQNKNERNILGSLTAYKKLREKKDSLYTVNFVGYYSNVLGYPSIVKDIKDEKGNSFYKIILMFQNDKLENHNYKEGQTVTAKIIDFGSITENLYPHMWDDYKEHYCRFDVLNKLD